LILAVDYLQMREREAAGDVQGGGVLRVFDEHVDSLQDWANQEVREMRLIKASGGRPGGGGDFTSGHRK
jgi:hypothetical protein